MDQRQALILIGLVHHYIKHGFPVGSSYLVKALSLSESPATIRAILQDLEEAGYLYQPHTSAGRIPTDQGYRYYVDATQPKISLKQRHRLRQHVLKTNRILIHSRSLSKTLADLSRTMAISAWWPELHVQDAGWSQLLNYPEVEERNLVREASQVLDMIDEHLEELTQRSQATVVFIGQENPFLSTAHLSLIARTISLPGHNQKTVLLLVGPKRMPYPQHIALLDALAEVINQQNI